MGFVCFDPMFKNGERNSYQKREKERNMQPGNEFLKWSKFFVVTVKEKSKVTTTTITTTSTT
jgi:hypothetical protein